VLKKITPPQIAISVYFFICGLIFSSWASRIPAIKDHFSFNEAELGAVLFTLPLGALSALPFSGWVVQKLGSKRISIYSLLLYSISLYFISTANTVTALSVALFLFGFIGNLANISMNTQGLAIQQILDKPILSKLHAMWSIGAFLAAAISGWTMKLDFTTSAHFIMIALMGLLSCLSVYKFLVKDQENSQPQKIFVLPTRGLILLGFICFCVAMSEGAMADWSSLYYRMALKDLQKISTTGYTAFAFSMAIGRFMGDKLIQLFGYKRVLKLNGLFILIGMSIALVFQSPVTVIIGFSLVGLGVSSVFPVVYILAAKTTSMAPSAALSAVSSVGFVGFLVGPPMIGFVAQQTGLRLGLGIVSFLGLFIWLLTFKIKK
jgi:MFS family permease